MKDQQQRERRTYSNQYKDPHPATTFFHFMIWKFITSPKKKRKNRESISPLPRQPLDQLPAREEQSITWLGHASFLITINQKRVLTDPLLTTPFYLRRITQPPCRPEQLQEIDYVLISHGHRDHLDKSTIKRLPGSPTFLVPQGMGKQIRRWRKDAKVKEARWWEHYPLTDLDIAFLPAHHWHARFVHDKNTMLWGSYLIAGKEKTIYFSGDTGYTKHFADIKQRFPKIDICLMPTTSYTPKNIVANEHMPIDKSLQAYKLLGGKQFIPFHYGTIDLEDNSAQVTMAELDREAKKARLSTHIKKLIIGKPHSL